MKKSGYALEDVREFFMKRPWLVGRAINAKVNEDEYRLLKDREPLGWPSSRVVRVRAFIEGWLLAKR